MCSCIPQHIRASLWQPPERGQKLAIKQNISYTLAIPQKQLRKFMVKTLRRLIKRCKRNLAYLVLDIYGKESNSQDD